MYVNLKTVRISGIDNSQDVIQDLKSNGFVKKLLLVPTFCFVSRKSSCLTVPLGDWLEKKNVTAIIIKQQFGFPMSTT